MIEVGKNGGIDLRDTGEGLLPLLLLGMGNLQKMRKMVSRICEFFLKATPRIPDYSPTTKTKGNHDRVLQVFFCKAIA